MNRNQRLPVTVEKIKWPKNIDSCLLYLVIHTTNSHINHFPNSGFNLKVLDWMICSSWSLAGRGPVFWIASPTGWLTPTKRLLSPSPSPLWPTLWLSFWATTRLLVQCSPSVCMLGFLFASAICTASLSWGHAWLWMDRGKKRTNIGSPVPKSQKTCHPGTQRPSASAALEGAMTEWLKRRKLSPWVTFLRSSMVHFWPTK